jgi:hypothetical protein
MSRLVFACIAVALAGSPALAQTSTPDAPAASADDSRYSFHRVDDGFLRLDARTGQVSLCSRKTIGFGCHAVPDERAALESEIARLQSESSALKKELLTRGIALPAPIKEDKEPQLSSKRPDPDLKLPSAAEMERVRVMVEKVWRRLVEMIVNLQKDMLQKT